MSHFTVTDACSTSVECSSNGDKSLEDYSFSERERLREVCEIALRQEEEEDEE
jgi:hypothetical protein